MNAQDFAAHTREQEIQRLLLQLDRLRKQREEWRREATKQSLEVGRLTEENARLRAELHAARGETA